MKTVIYLFIMTSISLKLNAFDIDPKILQMRESIQKIKPKVPVADLGYRYLREEEINNDKTCSHCPKYLLLTEQVNKVAQKIAQDPKLSISDELPVNINRLKFLYYTEAMRNENGEIVCKRYMDLTPDLKPTKFDGQFKLIAADALKYEAVTDVQFLNPDVEEVVYYYRGDGDQKDIIVQAIFTKKGGRFRYFKYTPTEKELNPYNLPDLKQESGSFKVESFLADDTNLKNNATKEAPAVSPAPAATVPTVQGSYDVNFGTKYENFNHTPIPRNIHFVDAKVDHEIFGGVKIQGSSDTSLRGNQARMALKNADGNDLLLVDVDTKMSGKTEHNIRIPYSVRVFDSAPKVQGNLQTGTNADLVTVSVTDNNVEYLRTVYRKNHATNTESYVVARDIAVDAHETVSMQYIKGDDGKSYASLRDARTLKNNVTLVLDVRVDQDRKATLFYQVSSQF